jgi:EAL domain-containing protein (putative c-di-GMP-specific phosphodiesterase class I)
MDDPENMAHVLYSLKDLGVQIAIDDFGMGYWSLNNLRRFSIDKIKIDRSFINRIPTDIKCVTIVTAIIAMASKLGIKVVAEGVETEEQYQFLVKEGCAEIQGYYLCQPLSGEIITEFLQDPISKSELLRQQLIKLDTKV